LLLDISDNEKYIWTTTFDPSVPETTPSPLPPPLSPSPPSSSSSNLIGVIVGSLLGGIFLSVGGFFIYKWNKNKQKQKAINENNYYNNYIQEGRAIPAEMDFHITNHEPIIPASAIVNNNYYYGQEVVPTPNNDRLKFFKFSNKNLSN
jgi:hypothetical protein